MKKIILLIALFLSFQFSNGQCPVPNPVTASPASICAGGTTSLNAISLGSSINWYTVPTGGTPIGSSGSGANFAVSPVVTTTYYAEAFTVGTQTFNFTGGVQSYTVPGGVTSLSVVLRGAQGGSCFPLASMVGPGAFGGGVSGTIAVVGGQVLNIYVGGAGANGSSGAGGAGGYNGGGQGAVFVPNYSGGGGGGASDIRVSPYGMANRLAVGAGGGGGAYNYIGSSGFDRGGRGGGLAGEGGFSGNILLGNGPAPGGGGTQVAGGNSGLWVGWCASNAGGFGFGGNGALGCTNSGGGGGSGYYGGGGGSWAGGGGGSSFLPGGTHTLGAQSGNGQVVIQGNGCVSVSRTAIVVTVNPSPTITVNSGTICSGQSFTMVPSGANTYTFQGGSPIVSPLVSTSYTVIGTSTNGCVSANSATSNVTVSGLPTITVNSGSICSGQSFTMVPSGAMSYTFQGGSPVVSPLVNTSYTVIGSNGVGCVSQNTAVSNVTVTPNPTITITGTNVVCPGLSAGLIGNGATSYSWSTGALTQSIAPSPTVNTTYTVYGTSLGCTSSAVQTVSISPNPTVTITGTNQVCVGSLLNLTANGASSYTWSNGALTQAIATTPTINTTYTVVGTSSLGVCTGSASIFVTVNPLPVITITGNNTVCAGSPLNLTANGANSYTWSTGAMTNTVTVNPMTNIIYTAAGSNSVTGCSNSATHAVTVSPIPSVTVTGPNAMCITQTINLTAFGAPSYTWSTGSTSSLIAVSPTVNTSYTVVGTSTNGCGGSSVVKNIVVNQIPSVLLSATSATICRGEHVTLTASGVNTYSWSTGALTSTIMVTPNVTTSYTVQGTNTTTGCYNTSTITINVSLCTGINESYEEEASDVVSIYPNPNNGEFIVDLDPNKYTEIIITDVVGRMLLSEKVSEQKNQINLNHLPNGIYFLRVQNDHYHKILKVVKN